MTGVNLTRALKVLSQRKTRLEIETSWKNSTEQTEEFVLAILRSVRKLKVHRKICIFRYKFLILRCPLLCEFYQLNRFTGYAFA